MSWIDQSWTGIDFGSGGHRGLAYRRIDAQREYLDYTEAPRSTESSRQGKFLSRRIVFGLISECARAMADAVQHNLQDPTKLAPSYALLSRIRLSSSTDVLDGAERIIQYIVIAYSDPNLTRDEIQSRANKHADPLREFSDICVLSCKPCKSNCDSNLSDCDGACLLQSTCWSVIVSLNTFNTLSISHACVPPNSQYS